MIEKYEQFDCNGFPINVLGYRGKVWFIGAQIASAIGYEQTTPALTKHCPDKVSVLTSEVRKAGVKFLGASHVFLVSAPSALRLVMKAPLPNADVVRDLFVYVIMPYIYANHASELGTEGVSEESIRMIYHQMSKALWKKPESCGTRITHEYQIKQLGKDIS